MEDIRRRIAQDKALYPDASPSIVSISSSSSAGIVTPPPLRVDFDSDEEIFKGIPPQGKPKAASKPKKKLIVISDDDSDAVVPEPTPVPQPALQPAKPVLVHIPNNRDILPPPKPSVVKPVDNIGPRWETFDTPDMSNLYDPIQSAADAEKALRDLLQDSVGDTNEEVDMQEAVVQGFREGVLLLPHQVVGKLWMKERESGKKTGGILADDMGLGKTIQTLTRIVEGRPRKSDKTDGWAAATLVVCPVGLVAQWASEIAKMAVGLRVIQHHGANRARDPEILKRAHVVITSYSIVASEHAVYSSDGAKDESSKSKKKKKASSDDEDELASESDSDSSADHFGRTLAKKSTKKPTGKKKTPMDALFQVPWFRIVLDEAHNIKNRKTKSALGCFELQAKYRWCLTGTPMQNNVEELYSLLKFLQIRPLNDWQTFNEQICKPVKSGRSVRAMKRLQVVLKSIMLRRRKDYILNGKPIIELPNRTVEVVQCEFDEDERAFYRAIEKKVEVTINKYMKRGEVMKNYTCVMVLLLRLRQACNHPGLISKDFSTDSDALNPKTPSSKGDDDDDGLADMFGQMGVEETRKKCQVCQAELEDNDATHCDDCRRIADSARRRSLHAGPSDTPPDSAKVRKIIELLHDIDERSDGVEKTIIFSQFTSMLDLIQPFLRAEGMKYVRYDGSMTKDKREESLEKIKNSKNTNVILISFKAGGTGLNLTACNNVILVDLWWNPALEDQAFDRAHRYGQTRDVNIFKLTVPETVEQRILELQDKKRQLAAAALSGDKIKNNKLGMDDLMALFRPGGRDDDEEE